MKKAQQTINSTLWLGYTRVSTDKQVSNGLSLDSQQDVIREAAKSRALKLGTIYTDAGISGSTITARPALNEALQELAQGRAAGLIVCKIDRICRSTLDYINLLDRAEKEHWTLLCLDAPFDASTPQGRMVAQIMAVFAEFERQLIRQRTRDGMAAKKKAGILPGPGSVLSEELVSEIKARHGKGETAYSIAKDLNRRGIKSATGKTWKPAVITKVANRPDGNHNTRANTAKMSL